jgi:hypothetical protein
LRWRSGAWWMPASRRSNSSNSMNSKRTSQRELN